MDAHDVMLCERCWHPISENSDHVVRQYRDDAHPLLASLFSYSHLEDDPACHAARSSRVEVVHDVRAVPVVVEQPRPETEGDGKTEPDGR
ncbi:hypothetical protein ACGFMK_24780 [Amycolatopsis sp. NPDC049252]|uniref:hypothetical protein n=1 Tax=Amycolatopsis sp. NPDC049252 TaxID=3363933 RepID=UPI00371CF4FE